MNANKSVKKIKKSAFALSYAQILKPGSYIVKASNCHKIFDEALGKYKYIVNLKAVAKHKIDEVIALFDGKEDVELSELNGLTMSTSIIMNEPTDVINVPMNNENVKVTADFRPSRKGEEILVITAIKVEEPVLAQGFNFEKAKPTAITEEARKGEPKPAPQPVGKGKKQLLPTTAADDASAEF